MRQIPSTQLQELLVTHGLGGVFSSAQLIDSGADRLLRLFERYEVHRGRTGRGSSLPPKQSWVDLLHQSTANPHRVRTLLQAVSLNCSPEMLAMLWMVELGASIKELHIQHDREIDTRMRVVLDLPGDEALTDEFISREHWDLALLQFVALAKVDELPVISGFVPLDLPVS